jgi:hypothetical protein
LSVRKGYTVRKRDIIDNSHKIEQESARARNDEILYSIIYEINKYWRYKGYDQIDRLYLEFNEFKQEDKSIIKYLKESRYGYT